MSEIEQLFPLPVLLTEKEKIETYMLQDMSIDAVSERIATVFDRKIHYPDKQLLAYICKHLLVIIKEIIDNGAIPYYLEKNLALAGFETKIKEYQSLESALMGNRRFTYGYYNGDECLVNVMKNVDQIRARLIAKQGIDIGVSFESVLAHELRHLASSYKNGTNAKYYHFGYDNFWISDDASDVRNVNFNEALTEHLTIDSFEHLKPRRNYKLMGNLVLHGFMLMEPESVIKNYYMGNLRALRIDLEPHFQDKHQIYELFSLSTMNPTNENILKIISIFKANLGHKYYDYISYLFNHHYIDLSILDSSLETQQIRKRG